MRHRTALSEITRKFSGLQIYLAKTALPSDLFEEYDIFFIRGIKSRNLLHSSPIFNQLYNPVVAVGN